MKTFWYHGLYSKGQMCIVCNFQTNLPTGLLANIKNAQGCTRYETMGTITIGIICTTLCETFPDYSP